MDPFKIVSPVPQPYDDVGLSFRSFSFILAQHLSAFYLHPLMGPLKQPECWIHPSPSFVSVSLQGVCTIASPSRVPTAVFVRSQLKPYLLLLVCVCEKGHWVCRFMCEHCFSSSQEVWLDLYGNLNCEGKKKMSKVKKDSLLESCFVVAKWVEFHVASKIVEVVCID